MPVIPLDIRPKYPAQYHVLWEPKEWRGVPDPDPFLVRRVGGSIFEIVAEWELTELEAKVANWLYSNR